MSKWFVIHKLFRIKHQKQPSKSFILNRTVLRLVWQLSTLDINYLWMYIFCKAAPSLYKIVRLQSGWHMFKTSFEAWFGEQLTWRRWSSQFWKYIRNCELWRDLNLVFPWKHILFQIFLSHSHFTYLKIHSVSCSMFYVRTIWRLLPLGWTSHFPLKTCWRSFWLRIISKRVNSKQYYVISILKIEYFSKCTFDVKVQTTFCTWTMDVKCFEKYSCFAYGTSHIPVILRSMTLKHLNLLACPEGRWTDMESTGKWKAS